MTFNGSPCHREGRRAGKQEVERCAKPVDVRPLIDRDQIASLFWRHVRQTAQHAVFGCQTHCVADQFGDAKVGQMRFLIFIEKDVAWFDISVNDLYFFTESESL